MLSGKKMNNDASCIFDLILENPDEIDTFSVSDYVYSLFNYSSIIYYSSYSDDGLLKMSESLSKPSKRIACSRLSRIQFPIKIQLIK